MHSMYGIILEKWLTSSRCHLLSPRTTDSGLGQLRKPSYEPFME